MPKWYGLQGLIIIINPHVPELLRMHHAHKLAQG
jgi:hypothetical protein